MEEKVVNNPIKVTIVIKDVTMGKEFEKVRVEVEYPSYPIGAFEKEMYRIIDNISSKLKNA